MQQKPQLTATYLTLIDQLATLLTRDNLVNNSYLFKFIKSNLMLPLYALVQERKINQITSDQGQIVRAVLETGLARVENGREVYIIDYPTIKISTKMHQIFKEIELVLKQHEKKYAFSERGDKQYINLTIYEPDFTFLEQLVPSLSKEVEFERVSLYEDMKLGVARVKKMKAEQKSNSTYSKNGTGKVKYSLERPPQVFIRRAIDSSDEEEAPSPSHKEKERSNANGRKKYRQAPKEKVPVKKPTFSNDDFPSLS